MMTTRKMEKVFCLKYLTVVIYISLLPKVGCQDTINTNVVRPDVTGSVTYYLDKSQDCNGNIREVSNQVIISAPGGSNGNSVPLSCTITLRTFTLKPTIFQLNIQTVDLECSMNFYIFDGTEEQSQLESYSCYTKLSAPVQRVTTGNTVSFRLTRQSEGSARYSIRIVVQTITDPFGGGGGGGTGHGVLNPDNNYLRKFSTDTIIILISVAYLAAILICIIILVVRCVKSSNEEKKSSERPLAYNNYGLTPATSVNSSVMSVYATKPPSDIKSIGRSKSFRSRMANSTEDTDSVFEAMQSNMKAQLNATSSHSSSYNNPSYQRTPPTKRLSGRRTAFLNNRSAAAAPTSRDHKRNHEAAVKAVHKPVESVKSSVSQEIQTDLFDNNDDGGDVTSEVELASTGMNTDPEMTDHGIQCEVETSDDIANSDEINAISKQAFEYLKRHKHSQSPSLPHPHGAVSDDEMGQKYERNRHYYPSQGLHGSPAMHHYAQPMEQYGSPEPPVLYYDPALRQANVTPPSYMRANGYRPQRGPKPPVLTDLDDQYIPVYSYLVNRGYKIPESNKNASGSSATGTSHHSDLRMVHTDDSDFSANLDSGVELMKR